MLYWGPLGLLFYGWFGRASAVRQASEHDERPMCQVPRRDHCGAGCALGDFLGDWIAFLWGLSVFGSQFGGKLLLSFLLAYLFGIEFQYFSVAPMRGLGPRDGLVAAVKIDTLSLLAYQAGMLSAVAARALVGPGLEPTHLAY